MTQNSGNNPNILIRMTVKASEFVASVKDAMKQGVAAINNQAKTFQDAFKKSFSGGITADLKKNLDLIKKQFTDLQAVMKKTGQSWDQVSKTASASSAGKMTERAAIPRSAPHRSQTRPSSRPQLPPGLHRLARPAG